MSTSNLARARTRALRPTALGSVLTLGAALALGTAMAQDKPAPAKPAAPAPAKSAAPAPAAPAPGKPAAPAPALATELPKPSPELDAFMKDVLGSWSCTTTFAPGAFGPGSPEIKATAKIKFAKGEAILGGFFYRGEFAVPKSKTVPMSMTGLFYVGYEPGTKQVTNVSIDNMGAISMGAGPLTATSASWTGEGYMMGTKMKTRETFTKVGPKEIAHKFEADMGKGFQVMGEDVCKK